MSAYVSSQAARAPVSPFRRRFRESASSLAFHPARSDVRGSIDSRVSVSSLASAREEKKNIQREREGESERERERFSPSTWHEGSEESKRMVERRREKEERKGVGEKSQLEVIDFSN